MNAFVCLRAHRAFIRQRFLCRGLSFLWCDHCGAIR